MSIRSLIDPKGNDIQFVFVGGKGGVGKTTCSCAIATQFAKARPDQKVLLISTDPAHNLSDAFGQTFGGKPTKVNGVSTMNLFAMETDPSHVVETEIKDTARGVAGEMVKDFQSWIANVPGIDEAMALSTVLGHVQSGDFDLIVFDTAPTGHTLRLLQLPAVLQIGIDKLTSWKAKLSGVLSSVGSLLFASSTKESDEATAQAEAMKRLEAKLVGYKAAVSQIAEIFRDQRRTQFVCVCIAEHLSVFETRRLISELECAKIKSEYVLVNQLVPSALANVTPESGGASAVARALNSCGAGNSVASAVREAVELCAARSRIQQKYLGDLRGALKNSGHTIVCLPLLPREVRGASNIDAFGKRMLDKPTAATTDGVERARSNPFEGLAQRVFSDSNDYQAHTSAKFFRADTGTAADVSLAAGTRVEIHSLKRKPEFNGSIAVVESGPQENGRYVVRLSKRKKRVKLKIENLRKIEDEIMDLDDDDTSTAGGSAAPAAITPELVGIVQRVLMRPNGIRDFLKHPEVSALRAKNPEMRRFFSDIESRGIMGALPYLSNGEVIRKAAAVATKIEGSRNEK